jgi:serine/threonine protein kinase
MPCPNPHNAVLLVSARGMRGILPTENIRDTGGRHGNTICVIPILTPVPAGHGRFVAAAQGHVPKIAAPGRTLAQLRVRLADFAKIKDIGRGAFGALYAARDRRTGGFVAVKVMRNAFTREVEPKVADFGLSKFVGQGATLMQTIRGGTLPYMAPELFGESDYAFPVDVYAFAILVYCAVMFMEPFPSVTSSYRLGQRINRGEHPKIPAFVGANWRELMKTCSFVPPEQRPRFGAVVQEMVSADFMDAAIDRRQVLADQQKVVPPELRLNCPPVKSPIEQLKDAADAGDACVANQYGERLRNGNGPAKDLARTARHISGRLRRAAMLRQS